MDPPFMMLHQPIVMMWTCTCSPRCAKNSVSACARQRQRTRVALIPWSGYPIMQSGAASLRATIVAPRAQIPWALWTLRGCQLQWATVTMATARERLVGCHACQRASGASRHTPRAIALTRRHRLRIKRSSLSAQIRIHITIRNPMLNIARVLHCLGCMLRFACTSLACARVVSSLRGANGFVRY